ncbi:ABC transporter ATP-binding protein/permease [Aquirhabdus parva]|uniref:ABC transporter ATP-binding protein/permease n=2 Tax=Aquirhabdus parva TaxID=2283318 RepID=A0A345PAW3_9GAMM|nr:ABC transporter ATP-binding protein/permease [Aquirhabdus parva]
MSGFAVIKSLLPYLWPKGEWGLRARVVTALVLLFAAKLTTSYLPILYKHAVDALSLKNPAILIVPVALIVAYGLTRVMALMFAELRDTVFARVQQHIIRVVGVKVFDHLHHLSLRFHLSRQTGGVNRSIERGTRAIDTLLSYLLFSLVPTLFEIGLVTIILWKLFNGWFALVTLLTVAAYLVFTFTITEWRTKFYREMNEDESRANTQAIDSLLNFETVKYFGNEALEAKKYNDLLKKLEDSSVKSQSSLSILNVGQGFIISIGLTIMMWMAAQGIQAGTMSIGDFVLVNSYLLQLYAPLNGLGFVYRAIKRAFTDMEKMFELLGVNREIADVANAPALQVSGGRVEFRDVQFGYDPRREILKGVSFSIPAGQTVAVVGASGAGKSTLSRLLFRFYDVNGGAILVDGQDIRQVTQETLRAALGIVPQDTVLFNDTIRYNIAYGDPSATTAEIEHTAKLAHIHEFILAMPDGYNTVVGERGLKLSGGEKQRVAIARTILKDPAILLFDEATSALDTHTEREIQANLREVSRGRTTLVIAHRLSTIVDANEILVMADGQIMERGAHAELLRLDGLYAAMWRQQQAERD